MSDGDHDSDDVSTAIVKHQLNIILIVACLGAMLVPIVGTLFAYNPPNIRRSPVFVLNVAACFIGISQAVATLSMNYLLFTSPYAPFPVSVYFFKIILLLLPPVFVDAVLIFRFLAFFPAQITPRRTLFTLLAFPAACKLARLVLIAVFLGTYPTARLVGPRSTVIQGLIWGRGPIVAAIFGLQAIDNAYASSVFLYKLYHFRKNGANILQDEVLVRIPSIFLIALGNYVFPVATNIVQTILTLIAPRLTDGIYIMFTNNFVTILGVVFATLWTSKQNWSLRTVLSTSPPPSSIQLRHKSLESPSSALEFVDEELGFYER